MYTCIYAAFNPNSFHLHHDCTVIHSICMYICILILHVIHVHACVYYTHNHMATFSTTADVCSRLEACSLCEDHPVCVMFQPCGHKILCHMCGSLAKRCLRKECRVSSNTYMHMYMYFSHIHVHVHTAYACRRKYNVMYIVYTVYAHYIVAL